MKHLLLSVLAISLFLTGYSQSVGINASGAKPDSSAILDVSSTKKGFLTPRMRLGQRDSIANPAIGLIIYQTDTLQGLYIYNGSNWMALADNLGNHTATQGINLGTNRIYNGNSSTGLKLDVTGSLLLRTMQSQPGGSFVPVNSFFVDQDGGLYSKGNLGVGIIPMSGAGSRMMWYPFKSSFRAGQAETAEWDDYNNGFYSAGFGYAPIASGVYSFAAGNLTVATGQAAVALGSSTQALGTVSFAQGVTSRAVAGYSVVFGRGSVSNGYNGFVAGMYNDTILAAPQTSVGTNSPMLLVGNGDNNTTRSNAFAVQKDGRVYIDPSNKNPGTVTTNALLFGTYNGTGEGISSKRTTGGNQYGLDLFTNFTSRLAITNGGKIGLNNTAPAAQLDVTGGNNWDLNNTEGDVRIGNGNYRLKLGVALAGGGAGGVGIMQYGQPNGYNVMALGAQGNNILYVNGNTSRVGIGTDNPTEMLTVAGNICATGSIFSCSDIRYKTNLLPIANVLSSLASIQPIYYNWKKEFKDKGFTDERQIGFSAQEVEKLYPEMVHTDEKGYKTIDYSRMTPVLVEAVKEQQQEINELRSRLDKMEKLLQENIGKK